MVDSGEIITGFMLAVIFSIIGMSTGLWGSTIGILTASLIVGYRVDGRSYADGLINGALIGVIGFVILVLIGFIYSPLSQMNNHVGLNSLNSVVVFLDIGAISGAIGSLVALIVYRIRRKIEIKSALEL